MVKEMSAGKYPASFSSVFVVGRLDAARLETTLPVERCVGVAYQAGDGNAARQIAKRNRLSVNKARRLDLRQRGRRYAEYSQHFFVPFELMQVEELGA